MSAVAHAAFGKTMCQSAKARFVVTIVLRFSYLRLTIWKMRSAAWLSYER